MTEAEWLACTDPGLMLEFLSRRASSWKARVFSPLGFKTSPPSDRKLRLFACACCRRAWHLLIERGRQDVVTAERCADAELGAPELDSALAMLQPPHDLTKVIATGANKAARSAVYAVEGALKRDAAAGCRGAAKDAAGAIAWAVVGEAKGASDAERWAPAWSAAEAAERRAQAALARDLFGNPFRPVVFDRTWLSCNGGPVAKLAQAVYEVRAFDRLPILADALEDAGCTNPDLLAHCREPGPHVRGCWVVDLLLGKQ
jgi:hypothetical protein